MSGIAGIANADGSPVSRELLLRMARTLAFRGPDAHRIWIDGAIGLGHAAHLIRGDETRSVQPETLGTGTWITADARLDAREELVAKLRARAHNVSISCSDAGLVLHAYDAWEEQCLEHLRGDFAFGLWDGRRQQLFCATDHFGVRQLYFSRSDSCLVFSNTLNAVREHPGVSQQLNDAAICDFLLFGMNYEEGTTSFTDIRRLPRAHWLRWSADAMEIHEYWRPPTDGEIRYKKSAEYVEHFNEVLGKAVADRLRGESAGILLSGGLDSSSVAAVCAETAAKCGQPRELHAFTFTSDDPSSTDGPAAANIARALGIPQHCWNLDQTRLFEGWGTDGLQWPEPVDTPLFAAMVGQFQQMADRTAVVLSGEGSDNLMSCQPLVKLRRLWRNGRRAQTVFEGAKHAIARFKAPDGVRGPLRRVFKPASPDSTKPAFPEWLNPALVDELALKERWSNPVPWIRWDEHPQHPKSYGSLFFPQWRYMFERQDPAYTQVSVEVRYPFLDLRLVEYLLAIPSMPWFFRKFLLREAMRRRLPEKIRKRPKTPLQRSPVVEALKRPQEFLLSKKSMAYDLGRYVRTDAILDSSTGIPSDLTESKLRAWCLNFWMQGLEEKRRIPATMRVGVA